MPIPFLAGLGIAAAGIVGAGSHLSAQEKNEKAQEISEEAQKMYNEAKKSLEKAQNKTEKALLDLGYAKKKTLDYSMNQFLDSYDKIKHIVFTESVGINELSKFSIDEQEAIELRKMTDIYSDAVTSGATGAVAGAVVALAASGSLSIIGSEMALAGSVLAAGEVGAAAGIAGSALSFGAAMTPLAAVAAPVILFTGISASMKADENLQKASTIYAEAGAAVEKMRVSETLCDAITDRSNMFNDLLVDLDKMFSECTSLLAGLVRKKEGRFFKKKLTSKDFSEEELKLIAVTRALAGAVKAVIDTPIISKSGDVSYESKDILSQTTNRLPAFNQEVQEVKQIDYGVKPIIPKQHISKEQKKRNRTYNNQKKEAYGYTTEEAKGLGWYCSVIFIYIVYCFYPMIGSALWILRLIKVFLGRYNKIVSTVILGIVLWLSFDAVTEPKTIETKENEAVEQKEVKTTNKQKKQTKGKTVAEEKEATEENIPEEYRQEIFEARDYLYNYLNSRGVYIPETIAFEKITQRGFLFQGYDYIQDQVVTSFVYSVDFDGNIYDELAGAYINNQNNNQNEQIGEFILPYSDSMYYTYEQLSQLDQEGLRLARNEIFARYGYVFYDEGLQNYFSQRSWYAPTGLSSKEIEDSLNEFEKYNVELIKGMEVEYQ